MGVEDIILSPEAVFRAISMIREKEILSNHKYCIYQGQDKKWYTYLPDSTKPGGRRKVKKPSYDEVKVEVIKHYESESITVEELFADWNDRRESLKKIKPSTASRNRYDFDRFFDDIRKQKVALLTAEDVSSFLEEVLSKFDISSKRFSSIKSIVRGMLRRAKKLRLIDFDIEPIFHDLDISDKEFRQPRIDDSREIFYDDEIDILIEYCKDHRSDLSTLAIALMFVSGIRVGEAVCLKKTDILDREIAVHRIETQYRKDGVNYFDVSDSSKTPAGVRRVIIPDSYQWILDDLLRLGGDDWIFTGIHGKRMHTSQVRKRLYAICRTLDIPVRSPHKLRKTYATILLDNKVDSKMIEKQMGHTDVSTTELHYHRDRKRTQQKRDVINSIAEFS